MITTCEISMYPFNADYKPPILEFIARLNTLPALRVSTGPTATLVTAEHAVLMQALAELLEWSWRTHGKAVYVTKFIPGFDPAES